MGSPAGLRMAHALYRGAPRQGCGHRARPAPPARRRGSTWPPRARGTARRSPCPAAARAAAGPPACCARCGSPAAARSLSRAHAAVRPPGRRGAVCCCAARCDARPASSGQLRAGAQQEEGTGGETAEPRGSAQQTHPLPRPRRSSDASAKARDLDGAGAGRGRAPACPRPAGCARRASPACPGQARGPAARPAAGP